MAESHEAFRAVYQEVLLALSEINALKPRHRMAAYTLNPQDYGSLTIWHCTYCGHTFATLGELIKGQCLA